jgi:S-adenosylmethionine:tRNA ribosyltransferase-isomerase
VRLEELDFDFPEDLIAQHPCEPRDACRLLVANPRTGDIAHRAFRDIVGLIRAGDVLVVNDSWVFPARTWVRKETGGRVELLFLRRLDDPDTTPEVSEYAGQARMFEGDHEVETW